MLHKNFITLCTFYGNIMEAIYWKKKLQIYYKIQGLYDLRKFDVHRC